MSDHGLKDFADLEGDACLNYGAMRLLFQHHNLPIRSVSPAEIASFLGPLDCLPLIVDPAGILMNIRSAGMRLKCDLLLEILEADLDNNIDITSRTGFESIFIGEFPTGLFNACAMPTKNGALVMVDSGLIRVMFCTLIALFLARTGMLPISQAVLKFSDIVGNYVRDPMEAYKPSTWIPSQQTSMDQVRTLLDQVDVTTRIYVLSPLAWYVIKFTVCHEYGHILLGHVRPDRTTVVQSPVGAINIADREWSDPWKNELEADAMGVDLLLKSDNSGEPSIRMARVAAPLLVFQTMSMIEKIERVLDERRDVSSTHPPGEIRATKIAPCISGVLNDKEVVKVKGLVRDVSIIGKLIIQNMFSNGFPNREVIS